MGLTVFNVDGPVSISSCEYVFSAHSSPLEIAISLRDSDDSARVETKSIPMLLIPGASAVIGSCVVLNPTRVPV